MARFLMVCCGVAVASIYVLTLPSTHPTLLLVATIPGTHPRTLTHTHPCAYALITYAVTKTQT